MKGRNQYYLAAVEAFGETADVSVGHGGKHPHLIIDRGGRPLRHPYPNSPSDHRSLRNWTSQLRRRFGLLGDTETSERKH